MERPFTPASSPHSAVPVVLVHGFKDDAAKMRRLARHLQAEGRQPHSCTVAPSWGQVGVDALAEQLKAFIEASVPDGQPVDLVGFSMGGLVSRYYLQRLGGLERVRRFVTIATPHGGSLWAWLLPNAACRQMRPGSAFLLDLARDADRLAPTGFTSFWTPFDAIVLPAKSAVLPAARCRKIWCLAHPLMVREPRCLRAVAEALTG